MKSISTAVAVPEHPALLSGAECAGAEWKNLAHYLDAHGMMIDGAQPIRRFAGGLANRNYLLILNGEPAVLRRPPDGELPPGPHDMAREHRILARLTNTLPFIPKDLHYCDDRSVIGVS